MEEAITARYWCYMCSQIVNPIMELEVKCPFCRSGFVEEMSNTAAPATGGDNQHTTDSDFGSDRALSLWAPILLGMMDSPRRRRRFRQRLEFEEDEDDDRNNDDEAHHGRDTELDRELESIIRRRRRSWATILQLLQGIRVGLASESSSGNPESDNQDRERDRERERVILINPFNQTIIVQGSYSSEQGNNDNNNSPLGSLGDYFIGPGLDLLLQHLAENDPNRYGTPPAQKEAIDALPTVAINENLQCSVCLDDFDVGAEAKEMPCKHKFHGGCILPWLELHSSCPVCRFQLPADESKRDSDGTRNSRNTQSENGSGQQGSGEEADGEGRNAGRGRRFTFPWPFNGLFSSSTPSSSSNANAGGDASESDDN
ncbi:E3 ubiquitin-protein ligase RING1 [Quillaja saponaria]|uniref:RING-type E3 ubiquitin transferase n=1 Tax=Quillaja saponaria TaxID=32244 RepID=A0AAD7LCA0_QUISA|nr:E3 ubiquitin-protein ligase RING1 [Quillaja saponaria]